MPTRRAFLKRSALATGGLLAAPLGAACAGVPVVDAGSGAADGVVLGLHPSSGLDRPEDAVRRTLAALDFSWLAPGDSVFVKVACNSAASHPGVTSPTAVRAVCEELFERGAGRVLVGDQSGVASVRLAEGDVRHSETRALTAQNGLLDAITDAGAEPHFFDDGGYEDGYVPATFPFESHWRAPPRIARVVAEVDHLVYLPRLASHCLTGYTHGHKIAVGFLRDDARFEMHHDAARLYERYTEVNYCEEIASRLRLVVTLAESVLIDNGPDNGAVAPADPRIVIASPHLANHDAVAVQLLTWAQRNLNPTHTTGGVPWGPWAAVSNSALPGYVTARTGIPWRSDSAPLLPSSYVAHDFGAGVQQDHSLARAYEILGGVPRSIRVASVGEAAPDSLVAQLTDRVSADVSVA